MRLFLTFFFIFLMSIASTIAANPLPSSLTLSRQLILVTAPSWNSHVGFLSFYSRNHSNQAWQKKLGAIKIVLGKNGLAQDFNAEFKNTTQAIKHEGDGKTPIGFFSLGPSFGQLPHFSTGLNYLTLNDQSVCVDDANSPFYNQIVLKPTVVSLSGEMMGRIPEYLFGSVIQYNSQKTPKAGSCIFFHIWKNDHTGTSGCVATDPQSLEFILRQLSSQKHPLMGIFPEKLYRKLQQKYPNELPSIE